MGIKADPFYWKKPANALVEALQIFCKELLADQKRNPIADMYALEERIWEYANKIKELYPRCKLKDLKSKVVALSSGYQRYELRHKRDNIATSIEVTMNFEKLFSK